MLVQISNVPTKKTHRRQQRNSLAEKRLLNYMLFAIIFVNTTFVSFLSLKQQNVAIGMNRTITFFERSLRQGYPDPVPVILAPKLEVAIKPPRSVIIGSNPNMEMKCSKHHVWENDRMWREAVLMPEICTTGEVSTAAVEQYQQKQLSLLMETLFSNNTDFTPCGAHCVYHLDSAYSFQYGHSMYGWVLQIRQNNEQSAAPNSTTDKRGCWLPFNSHTDTSSCVVHFYNHWIGYVEDVEKKQRKLPPYNHFSGSTTSISNQYNPTIIQEQMAPYQPKCANVNGTEASFFKSSIAPFCHFRSYDGRNSIDIRKLHDLDQGTGNLEFSKNLKPSEILHLFGRHQLGIDDLSDALTLMNETFIDLDASSCSASNVHLPQHLLLCVYHRESIPRSTTVPRQYGSKVPIKGWQYRTLDGCFIPVENMEFSESCGRHSDQYNTWTRNMSERLRQYDNRQVESTSKMTKCDRLPLSQGRNYRDTDTDEFVFLPPIPTTDPQLDGVKYSEESICGPRIIVAGAMKCGTNTIGTLLSYHPRVKIERCSKKKPNCDPQHFTAALNAIWENHGLSHRFKLDPIHYVGKYAKKLPLTEEYEYVVGLNGTRAVGRGSLSFDKSPSYLNTEIFPHVAKRAKQLLPNAKVIVSLCNPVERMYSEYHHVRFSAKYSARKSEELFFTDWKVPVPANFTEFINHMKFSADICSDKPLFCDELRRNKLRTGIYHEQIKEWRNAFGPENVLVLDMDESSESKMRKITSLMGDYLPSHEYPWEKLGNDTHSYSNTLYTGRRTGYLNHTQAFGWLRAYFYRHNTALAAEIAADWPLSWNQKP